MCAKLAHFYGWTPDIIDNIDEDTAYKYWEAITVIEAQDTMIQMRIADYPMMKTHQRRDFHRSMVKKAYPKTFDPDRKPLTTEQLAERLGAMING